MITEAAFVGSENLPEEMSAVMDRPWNFVGVIQDHPPAVHCHCDKCNQRMPVRVCGGSEWAPSRTIRTICLRMYRFITDDMIEVYIYFGICQCGAVYWARSGPPFRRVRARTPQYV